MIISKKINNRLLLQMEGRTVRSTSASKHTDFKNGRIGNLGGVRSNRPEDQLPRLTRFRIIAIQVAQRQYSHRPDK